MFYRVIGNAGLRAAAGIAPSIVPVTAKTIVAGHISVERPIGAPCVYTDARRANQPTRNGAIRARRDLLDVKLKQTGLMTDGSANRPIVAVFPDFVSRVFAVHEGDLVDERYRLKRVMVDAVEISDTQCPRDKTMLQLTGDEDTRNHKHDKNREYDCLPTLAAGIGRRDDWLRRFGEKREQTLCALRQRSWFSHSSP